jgi:hypothetical protein
VLHHRRQIQDQHHLPISENGSAVDQIGGESLVIQSLDHQFFFAFQRIDDQSIFLFARR